MMEIKQSASKDISEQLNDPNFNISEWIESQNKILAESLFEQYHKRIGGNSPSPNQRHLEAGE